MDKFYTFFTQLKTLFLANKRVLIPLIPLVLFVLLFIFIVLFSIFAPSQPPSNQQTSPTGTPEDTTPAINPTLTENEENSHIGDEGIVVFNDDAANFEEKETLPDGSIKYALTSERAGRPNIIITREDEETTLFRSSVMPPNNLPLLSDYLTSFGQPERTLNGSKFYGSNARTYIYSQAQGFAFIAIPQNNTVLEAHFFTRMSIDEYIKKYGEDITPAP